MEPCLNLTLNGHPLWEFRAKENQAMIWLLHAAAPAIGMLSPLPVLGAAEPSLTYRVTRVAV